MSQDIVSDVLNEMRNAKRAKKNSIKTKRYSKVLIEILKVGKKEGFILDFKINEKEKELEIYFKFNECKAIKPRYEVGVDEIEKYMRRFLPSRNFGIIVISTSKGLVTHKEALEQNIGGSLIAYFY